MSGTTGVLIVCADPVLYEGLRTALESGGLTVSAQVDDPAAAIVSAASAPPRLCLVCLPADADPRTAVAAVIGAAPGCGVVVMADYREVELLYGCIRAGAISSLPRDLAPAHLADNLRRVLAGEATLPATLVRRLAAEVRADRERRLLSGVRLTAREWEIAELLRAGLSTAAIADRLVLSPVTVRRHIGRMAQRLGVSGRRALQGALGQEPAVQQIERQVGQTSL